MCLIKISERTWQENTHVLANFVDRIFIECVGKRRRRAFIPMNFYSVEWTLLIVGDQYCTMKIAQ